MFRRFLDLPALVAERSFFLLGPRQTGKSTLLRASFPDALFLDLLDAQTASHSADLGASATVYNFMLALMELYRSVAVVGFLEPAERRSQWVGDLKAWCAQSTGASTPAPAMVSVKDASVTPEKN